MCNTFFRCFCICACVLISQIAVLLDYYRQLAMKEKLDKEKKKYSRRRSYLQLSVSISYSNRLGALIYTMPIFLNINL